MTPAEFKAAMDRAGPAIMSAVHDRLLSYAQRFALGKPPRLVRQNLHGRSGTLGRSFRARSVANTPSDVGVAVYSTHPGSRLQEKGGTVVAKGKRLAIPLDAALTEDAGAARGSPRQWPDSQTYVVRVKGSPGRALVMLRGENGAAPVPLFLLLQSVTVPGRLGFVAAWESDGEARNKAVAEGFAEGLRRAL